MTNQMGNVITHQHSSLVSNKVVSVQSAGEFNSQSSKSILLSEERGVRIRIKVWDDSDTPLHDRDDSSDNKWTYVSQISPFLKNLYSSFDMHCAIRHQKWVSQHCSLFR